MSRSRTQLENWIKGLDIKAKKILDVGGSQLPLIDRIKIIKGLEKYKILDLPQPHETRQDPHIAMDLNDKYAMEQFAEYKNYFSAAFCLEVMEYIYNPVQALENMSYFIKKGGKLYISFHFYYPVHKPHGKDYLRYTEFGAVKLLENAGFDVHRVDMRLPSVESAALIEQYDGNEGNKRDPNYGHHYVNGFLITAIKQ